MSDAPVTPTDRVREARESAIDLYHDACTSQSVAESRVDALIAAVRAERGADLRKTCDDLSEANWDMRKRLAMAEAEIQRLTAECGADTARVDELRKLFRKYGEHDEGCWSYDRKPCNCGFEAAWFATFPDEAPAFFHPAEASRD